MHDTGCDINLVLVTLPSNFILSISLLLCTGMEAGIGDVIALHADFKPLITFTISVKVGLKEGS